MTPFLIRPTRVWMSLVFIGLLLASIALPTSFSRGQDETATPTEQEPPTAPSMPTATETLAPTDLPSPTAAWTETSTPTETPLPTASPTETESPTPTETATATQTATPSGESPTPGATVTIPASVGPALLLSETAEAETGWWSLSGTWSRSNVETTHSGEWVFSDSPGVPYTPNTVSALTVAQPLSLPPNSQIQLRYWQRLDLGASDSAQAQVSTDGQTWLTVASDMAVRNLDWTARTIRLNGYAGQFIWIRFVLTADNDVLTVGDGWWLDDITVISKPLPVTPLYGLNALESDNAALWMTEGNWRATAAPTYGGSIAWTVSPQPETAVALTLDADVNLSALTQPELRFWQLLDLAAGGDSAEAQVSVDGGQSWRTLAAYSAANNVSAWNEQVIDLSGYAGQTVRVRFLLVTDGDGITGLGWTVDGIALESALAAPVPSTETVIPTIETATPTPTPDSAGWTLYADTHPLLLYGNGTWQTFAVAGTAGGTLTATADTGATLTARFEGTGIRVIYSRGPEGRLFSGQVDDFSAQTADGYGETYSYGYALTFGGLPDGQHTLTVTNGDDAMWIEAVEVQGVLIELLAVTITPTPTATAESIWTTYADTDPQLVYDNGTWEALQVAGAEGGTLTGTANPGATLTVYFEGTGIRILHSKGPEGGLFDARVDGDLAQAGDGFDATYSYRHMVAFEGLPDGQHVLVVTNGNDAIWIEAVELAGVLLPPVETNPPPTEMPTATLEATPEVVPPVSPPNREMQAVTFTVNTTADTSDANTSDSVCDTDLTTEGEQCSLQAAIQQANTAAGTDTIAFNIPGTGVQTITLLSALPTITDPVVIDGYTQPGAAPATDSAPATLLIELNGNNITGNGLTITAGGSTVRGLVINRFYGDGIRLTGSGGNFIQGNYIGSDATGTSALGNSYYGVWIDSSNNAIGGTDAGVGNLIAYNMYAGVLLNAETGNGILSNSIFSNGTFGIDLYPPYGVTPNDLGDADTGTNMRQNYPVLSSVTAVGSDIAINGTLNSRPNKTFRIELFASIDCDNSEYGEGQMFLGFTDVTTNSGGNASFFMTFATPSGDFITATATDGSNNTSEFSKCQAIALPAPVSAAPTLISPTSSTLTNDNTPTFVWGAVTNATSYEIQVATNLTFKNIVYTASGAYIVHTPDMPLGDGVLYWRVRGLSSAGNGVWSAKRTFTVDTQPPQPPVLSAPADGATLTTARPTFSWRASATAKRYRIQVSGEVDFASTLLDVTDLTTTSHTATISLPQGVYYWRVQAWDAAGNWGNFSLERTFKVNIQRSPADHAFTTDTTPIFTWSTWKGATRYQLQVYSVATPDCGSPVLVVEYLTTNASVLSYTPSTPLGEGMYCWRVNVEVGGLVVSPFYHTLTVTPPRSAAPALTWPSAAALLTDNTPELRWAATTSTAGSPFIYQVQIDDDLSFTNSPPPVALNGLSYTPDPLADGRYYWRVRAINYLGFPGTWSTTRTFTVDTQPPQPPLLSAPADGATLTAARPTFSWRASATAKRYRIELSTEPTFSLSLSAEVTTTSYVPSSPLLYTIYYWRVRALDAAGNISGWSAVRSVQIVSPTTAVPLLNRFMTNTPTLTWRPISWTNPGGYYQVQVDDSINFTSLEYQNMNIATGTQSILIDPLRNGTWYWRVRACTATGACGTWSTTGTFTIEA